MNQPNRVKVLQKSKTVMVLPVRTCVACRARKSGPELLRFTVQKMTAALLLDGKKKETGRGVYCCKNSSCLEIFVRNKKRLKKTLGIESLDISVVERLL